MRSPTLAQVELPLARGAMGNSVGFNQAMIYHGIIEGSMGNPVIRTAHVPLRVQVWDEKVLILDEELTMPVPLTKVSVGGLDILMKQGRLTPDEAVFLLAKEAVKKTAKSHRPGLRCEVTLCGLIRWEK